AATLATLRLVEATYMKSAAEEGRLILQALGKMKDRHARISDVRGKRLMISVEFVRGRVSKEPDPEIHNAFVHAAVERNLLLLDCDRSVCRIAPPLSIERPQVEEELEIFSDALDATEA